MSEWLPGGEGMVRFELSSGDEWMDGRADLWAVFPFFFFFVCWEDRGLCLVCVSPSPPLRVFV